MRKSGPNGMSVGGATVVGANGHGAATSVHADQDVYGTPLTQLMDGRAPSLFAPRLTRRAEPRRQLMLVNVWIPLRQITQPLVLADGRSIDRRRHQLRYGLATTSFLERDDDMVINDIWTFLHDPGQRWYLRSQMDHRSAYVFNTLSTPHGACTCRAKTSPSGATAPSRTPKRRSVPVTSTGSSPRSRPVAAAPRRPTTRPRRCATRSTRWRPWRTRHATTPKACAATGPRSGRRRRSRTSAGGAHVARASTRRQRRAVALRRAWSEPGRSRLSPEVCLTVDHPSPS